RIYSPVPARERVREIVSELTGIGGAKSIGFGPNRVRSLPDAIAKVLANHSGFRVNGKVEDKFPFTNGTALTHADAPVAETETKEASEPAEVVVNQLTLPAADMAPAPKLSSSSTSLFDICPECGTSSFAYEEGCKKCYSCGYSEC